MNDAFIVIVAIVILSLGIFAGAKFAKGGKARKDIKFHCPHCGTEIPYIQFAQQACPACRRSAAPSASERRIIWFQLKNNRFMVGFLGVLGLLMSVCLLLMFFM